MQTNYSTYILPYIERVDYWKDVINNAYFPLELNFYNPQSFQGKLSQWELGRIGVSRLSSSATYFKRMQHQIDNSESYFLITIPENQKVEFTQANNTVVCHPGSFILERSDLPYEFSFNKDNALWVIRIPLSLLRSKIREPDRFLYMEFDKQRGIGAVFYSFMLSVIQEYPCANDSEQAILSNQLIDLLVLTLQNDDRVLMSSEAGLRSVHLRNIESFVRNNIRDPELSPDIISNACNISTRYLHTLFKGSNQTISQWIKELRLQSALSDIKANTGYTTLAEIAYGCGFKDQAQFCRLFKIRFDCTPKKMRG
jgi:AraC-like DNA-binding protein